MKLTARKLCLRLYITGGLIAMTAFLGAHGGWRGDVDPFFEEFEFPDEKNIHAPGQIFNRWRISNDEPLAFRVFSYANLPASLLALLLYRGLETFIPPFNQTLLPFGLSYPTYQFLLFLIFGFGQWMLIGTLIDKWRARKGRSGTEKSGKGY